MQILQWLSGRRDIRNFLTTNCTSLSTPGIHSVRQLCYLRITMKDQKVYRREATIYKESELANENLRVFNTLLSF